MERTKKKFWVIDEGSVALLTGYSCEPTSPGMWWFPTVGYSLTENQIFETEQKAIERAKEKIEDEIEKLVIKLEALNSKQT